MTNRLASSRSSYLKKASDEPVDWYPWSDEAFERARREDKPVLLSIGAVWCHWCHAMAHECWHDPEIARIINEKFIAIKVDRDERPDIDKSYQEAVSALTGQSGWPLTVFLTPDRMPFYGGTYFPNKPRHGLPSLKDVLNAVSDTYTKDRGSVERVVNDLRMRYIYISPARMPIDPSFLNTVMDQIKLNFDTANGGFGTAPKFPYSEVLLYMLQRYETSGGPDVWQIIDTTLHHMAAGGIYDQVGGGFHRYATDAQWKVPHFEKMLNDNALLLRAYLEAYQRSGSPYFRQVSEEILGFVLRDMVREPAGFASSMDADLHGEEGGYFIWTEEEIRQLLGGRADRFCKAYNVRKMGNFEAYGKNVLYIPGEEDKSQFAEEKRVLLDARYKRDMPFVDKTLHTSWTSLMITSMVLAFNILGDKRYLDYAIATADFMLGTMYRNGTLYHTYTDSPSVDGFLEDYSCLIEALLELYNTTQDKKYLDGAVSLTDACDTRFFDHEHGGYFYVQAKDRTQMTQDKPLTDFSVPASNPQMAINLIKLRYYTDDEKYFDKAGSLLEGFFDMAKASSLGNATFFRAIDYYINRPDQIVVVSDRKEGERLIDLVNSHLSKRIVLLDTGREERKPPVFEGKMRMNGKPTVYFCKEGSCTVPLNDVEDIRELLKRPMFHARE